MNWKEFIISILSLISYDIGFGFIIYICWKYIDDKYFSKLEINVIKKENEYLREENRKIGGSGDFWKEEDL